MRHANGACAIAFHDALRGRSILLLCVLCVLAASWLLACAKGVDDGDAFDPSADPALMDAGGLGGDATAASLPIVVASPPVQFPSTTGMATSLSGVVTTETDGSRPSSATSFSGLAADLAPDAADREPDAATGAPNSAMRASTPSSNANSARGSTAISVTDRDASGMLPPASSALNGSGLPTVGSGRAAPLDASTSGLSRAPGPSVFGPSMALDASASSVTLDAPGSLEAVDASDSDSLEAFEASVLGPDTANAPIPTPDPTNPSAAPDPSCLTADSDASVCDPSAPSEGGDLPPVNTGTGTDADADVEPAASRALPPATGDLIVTEVMISPSGPSPESEWFEIYNARPTPALLSGLTIFDDSSTTHTIASDSPVVAPPLSYVLFVRDRVTATANGLPEAAVIYDYGAGLTSDDGIHLNGAAGLSLWNGTARLVDVPFGGWDAGHGQTIELGSLQLQGSDSPDQWCYASAPWATGSDYGTPGSASDCP